LGARNVNEYNNRMSIQGQKKAAKVGGHYRRLADLMIMAADETAHITGWHNWPGLPVSTW
jgi:hypothetical protein